MRNMIYWWIFLWLQVIGYATAGYLGVFHLVLKADITYISFVIIAVHLLATLWVGWQTNGVSRYGQHHEVHLDTGWFLSEACMMLGMIGTIVGFIYTLVTTLGMMGAVDPAALQRIISELAKGIGTAGWTTLFGLIACLSIKLQMNNLESLHGREA